MIFITDMRGLFKDSTRTDFSGIEEWNVSNVITMYSMFENAKHFNANINSWNVSNVRKISDKYECGDGMFEGATSFNQSIDDWDLKSLVLEIPVRSSSIDDYMKYEKKRWDGLINVFTGSPLETNPPKWYKEKFGELIKKYEGREREVEEFCRQEEKEKAEREAEWARVAERQAKERAEWEARMKAAETKEKVKKLIWIGLAAAAFVYFLTR